MEVEKLSSHIQRVYLALMLFSTLATSFIWGINTLFLLDAGLSNVQAFGANAFFTLGSVIFEVPTGVLADVKGRKVSYMLGTLSLSLATLLYLGAWQIQAPFWIWAATSLLLGLGFTFFSGATEAWLVDALDFAKFKGPLESVFAKGQIVGGIAMLTGSVAGGVIAQATNLGIPYILRAIALGITFLIALIFMKDLGFEPSKSSGPLKEVKRVFTTSIKFGWNTPAVKWMMLSSPFISGVGFYTFYALQPYLLELYGDKDAYSIAGLAAAIVAGAQILGGLTVPYIKRIFKLRTSFLLSMVLLNISLLVVIGIISNFWIAIVLLCIWGLIFAASSPIRQTYLNGLIPSKQRATVLSFDSLIGSSGGIVIQPVLGRVADVWSYALSLVVGGIIQVFSIPFILLARKQKPRSDIIE